jgi:hypothetical protein
MVGDKELEKILGLDLAQEDISYTNENSFTSKRSKEEYPVITVNAPQSFIDKLNKLLEAADIANTIIKSGKINYYTAESLFNIYPFITEAQVSRTTKNMSTINYDSIKETMIKNMDIYASSLSSELAQKWSKYEKLLNEVYNSETYSGEMVERTVNRLHAFSKENVEAIKALVTFYYIRKFKVVNGSNEEELYFKFSDLNEENIEKYSKILEQDTYYSFIIRHYGQLPFDRLLKHLHWLVNAITSCCNIINNYFYSPNKLVAMVAVFYSLSMLNNKDINDIIEFIKGTIYAQYGDLKAKYILVQEDLENAIKKIVEAKDLGYIKAHVDDFLMSLTNQMQYLEDIRFIYNHTVKSTKLLDDIKVVLDDFKSHI